MSTIVAFSQLRKNDKLKLSLGDKPATVLASPTTGLLPGTMTVFVRLPCGSTDFLDGMPGQPVILWEEEKPLTSKSDANNKKQATRNGFEWYNKLESARKAGVAGVAAIGLLLEMAGTPAGAAVQGARALPRYNVEAACAQAAGGARAREQSPNWVQAFNACLEPEQQAYDFLQYAWPETDPRVQQVCLSSGPTYGGRIVFTYGTYQRLANCVWQRRNDGAAHRFMQ